MINTPWPSCSISGYQVVRPISARPQEVERQKLTETITPLSSINPRVTIEQDGMLLRALSVYPEDRYPTILAFAEAMLGSLNDKPASTSTPEAGSITPEPELSDTPAQPVQEPHGVPTEQESEPSASTEQPEPPERAELEQEPATTAQETATEPEQAIVTETKEISADQLPEMPQTDAPVLLDETQDAYPFDDTRVIIASPYANDPLEVSLKHDEVTIGRAGSSDILLDHDNLTSRHHALFRREAHGYILYDRRSANGVYVNGQKISSEEGYELMDGDHISIGNYELIFRSSQPHNSSAQDRKSEELSARHELTQLI